MDYRIEAQSYQITYLKLHSKNKDFNQVIFLQR